MRSAVRLQYFSIHSNGLKNTSKKKNVDGILPVAEKSLNFPNIFRSTKDTFCGYLSQIGELYTHATTTLTELFSTSVATRNCLLWADRRNFTQKILSRQQRASVMNARATNTTRQYCVGLVGWTFWLWLDLLAGQSAKKERRKNLEKTYLTAIV